MLEVIKFFDEACGFIWSVIGVMVGVAIFKATFDVMILFFKNKKG